MPETAYPILELTPDSGNDVICREAFDFAKSVGYMVFATTALDGVSPTARGLEVHYLDDTQRLYIGAARGKPTYLELKKWPWLTGVIIRDTIGRLAVSVRITSHVKEVDPEERPDIYERYWEQNPGTKALYRRDLSMFRIFLLDSGEGEIFHLPTDDQVRRVRFTFGGARPRPWAYEIDRDKCLGCGVCAESCMESVISPGEGGAYEIDHFRCLECGRCFENCPNGAILRRCGDQVC